MLKLFLIAQAFHAASGLEVDSAETRGSLARDKEIPGDIAVLAGKKPIVVSKATKNSRHLPKPLVWILAFLQLATLGTGIPSVAMGGIVTFTKPFLFYVALALCGSANFSIFVVFVYSFFTGGKSNRFPLFIITVIGKLFTIWLSFILNFIGAISGIAFLALNAGTGGGVMPLVHITTSLVVFVLNLAYFCTYHMPSLGVFSLIYVPKLGFAATLDGNDLRSFVIELVMHTAAYFGIRIGSQSFLTNFQELLKIVAASRELKNYIVLIAEYVLAQWQKQEEDRKTDPGGAAGVVDGPGGGPSGSPVQVTVGGR